MLSLLHLAFKLACLLQFLVEEHDIKHHGTIDLQDLNEHLLHFLKKVRKTLKVIIVHLRSLVHHSLPKNIESPKYVLSMVSIFLLYFNLPVIENTVDRHHILFALIPFEDSK